MKVNSKNNQLRELYDKVMLPNYSPASFIPERAEGSRLWDKDNKEYIDFGGGIAVNSLGHSHPELVKALTDQSKKIWHLSNYLTNEPAIELAERLTKHTFAENIFFSNSGSEANETAIKIARKFHASNNEKRDRIVSFKNSFHGRSLLNISLGSSDMHRDGFEPLMPGIIHGKYNDIDELENLIDRRTAAVIVEPVQGEAGVFEASKEFMQRLRDITLEHNALLIVDEGQSGVGRTGSLYGYMNFDIVPDIITSAKGLGGGIPIGATLTTKTIGKFMQPGTHGSTFGGNPLACSVANKVVEIVSEEGFLTEVKRKEKIFLKFLSELKKDNVISDIRSAGLWIGCDLVKDTAESVLNDSYDKGLIMVSAGANCLRLAPALNIPDEDILKGLEILKEVLGG